MTHLTPIPDSLHDQHVTEFWKEEDRLLQLWLDQTPATATATPLPPATPKPWPFPTRQSPLHTQSPTGAQSRYLLDLEPDEDADWTFLVPITDATVVDEDMDSWLLSCAQRGHAAKRCPELF